MRAFIFLAFVLPAAALAVSPAGAAPRKALVLSTASINGEVKSCGCEKKDIGGISRRASVFKSERAKNPAYVVVDAGDFGSHSAVAPWMATEFQWDMMSKLGYDVVTPGPNEMIDGLDQLRALYAKAPQIQVVSANVTDKSGKQIWSDYTIIDRGGVKFGITGVTDPAFYAFNQSRGLQKHDDFEFKDMRQTLERVLPDLRPKCDLLVVLLHTASGDAEKVLKGLDGIDVAVVGHQATYKFLPQKVGNTLTVQAGARGQYVGVLEVTLDGPGNVTAYSGENRPLGDGVVPDPAFETPVNAFAKKYKALEDAYVKEHGLADDGT